MTHQAVEIRPAELQDASRVNEIFIERKFDTTPGYDEYNQAQVRWAEAQGSEKKHLPYIERSLSDPERYLCQVACVGELVVAYTKAEAPLDEQYTWWRGLMVAREYDRRGIGRQLEAARQEWARTVCRPIRCLVANERSKSFFLQQGFGQVGTQTLSNTPILFDVMEVAVDA